MIDYRSVSQVLFGFLPEQTVDLKGKVWKVKDWITFTRTDIDIESIRRAVIRQASLWESERKDGGFVNNLRKGYPIKVVTIDDENGVKIEPFPSKSWVCKNCFRVHPDLDSDCQCGKKNAGRSNLYFVGFHNECGAIREPYIPKCNVHGQVRVNFPGTASAAEILFDCPVCNKILRKGFGNINCECGKGNLKFLPHRASSVYTPHNAVIVNPPDKEKIRTLTEAGGPPRALSWVMNGMKENNIVSVKSNIESLRRTLMSQGLPEDIVEKMLHSAEFSGEIGTPKDLNINKSTLEEAESQAVTIALATLESRVTLNHLMESQDVDKSLKQIYQSDYPLKLKEAGVKSIDLIDKFPVLTTQFGYTRGGHNPGVDKLTPFKSKGGREYVLYSDLAETEALFIQLDPFKIAMWLEKLGFNLGVSDDEETNRERILKLISDYSSEEDSNDISQTLMTLIHSFSHRFIRIASVFSGIDRNGLSELLVPYHLGFFVYGAAKGDFVLGGLQAVFETELHRLLEAIVHENHRCAMDPACSASGGACVGCLHLGEPSCRHFNMNLDRGTLFGELGYLTF